MHLKSKGKKQRPRLKPRTTPAVPQRLNNPHDAGTCQLRPPSLPLPERPAESKALRLSGARENQPGRGRDEPGSGKDGRRSGNAGGERGSQRGGRAGPAPPRAPSSAHARSRPAAQGGMASGPERGARPRPGTPGRDGGDAPGRLPGRGSRGVGPGSGHSVSPWQRREGRGGGKGRGAGARQGPRMSRRRGAGAAAGGARLPRRGGAGVGMGAGPCRGEGRGFPFSKAFASPAGCSWNGSSQQRVPCILPTARPCLRQLFYGEVRSEAAAGKCALLHVLSN